MGLWAQIEELKSANKRLGVEVKRLRGERLQAYLTMRHVTIRPDEKAEGAVAALWRMLKSLEWAGNTTVPGFMTARKCRVCGTVEESRDQKHAPDCELDAALARFEVDDTDTSADTGAEGEGR